MPKPLRAVIAMVVSLAPLILLIYVVAAAYLWIFGRRNLW